MKMPVLFTGHGSPMNAIEDNRYRRAWKEMGKRFPHPTAIIDISAHWITKGIRVADSHQYKQIYDMYGFPEALYQMIYAPTGKPSLAHQIIDVTQGAVTIDNSWGLDHGLWSVLTAMYPKADIPLVTMSVDPKSTAQAHYDIGKQLRALRDEGVLILASGNIVHNLMLTDYRIPNEGFDWAVAFDKRIKDAILAKNHPPLIDYPSLENKRLAFSTDEHFLPLLTALGATTPQDTIEVWNEGCNMGALSMTSYLFTEKEND